MAIKIKFDPTHNPQFPTFILATRSFKKLGVITNITDLHIKDNLNAPMDVSFTVHKSFDADPINRTYSDGGIIVADTDETFYDEPEEDETNDGEDSEGGEQTDPTPTPPVPTTSIANIQTYDSEGSTEGFNIYVRVEDELIERKYALWDEIKNFRKVWVKEWDTWFTLTYDITESNEIVKHITLVPNSEFELSNNNVHNLEINTESDILRENYTRPTIFYDAFHPEASLLNRLLTFMKGFTVKHVDASLRSIQRTFSLDGQSVYDAFMDIAQEIECLFVFGSGTNLDGSIERSVSAYDLRTYCYDCQKRSEYDDRCSFCGSINIQPPYGEDTTIFVDTEALADSINLSTDTDSVKNCFRLLSGDGLMDAAIIASNPNGTQYLWYFSDAMKEDMSPELKASLIQYDLDYDYYQNNYTINANSGDISVYNRLIAKYQNVNQYFEVKPDLRTVDNIVGYASLMNVLYDVLDFKLYLESGLMPTVSFETNAIIEANKITAANIPDVAVQNLKTISKASADNAVLSVIKTIVDRRYNVKINSTGQSTFDTSTKIWTGSFIVTSMSDNTDTAMSETVMVVINGNYEEFVKQKINKTIAQSDKTNYSIGATFNLDLNDFKFRLRQYSLAGLNSFLNAGNAALGTMVELGLSAPTTAVLIEGGILAYQNIYVPYYNKVRAIETELALRESEISAIETMRQMLLQQKYIINEYLNIEKYLGQELTIELYSYKMEDDYENGNYISEGLDNATLFKHAEEYIEVASREIRKAAIEHHSISTDLNNLLTIKEFEPLVDYFAVGNWLRARIDGRIYKLKLLSYEINFDSIEHLNVEFSDAVGDVNTSVADILSQAKSMTKSYGAVVRQAKSGADSKRFINSIANQGLDLTTSRIINTATNQTQQWDENGILLREYDDITDSYSEVQMKIINSTLAVTKDNWASTETAVGRFYYPAPKTGEITEGYGVIARTIIGNIILGENVSVYNPTNSIEIAEDGIVITTNGDDAKTSAAITVQKQYTDHNGNTMLSKQMYIDEKGNLVVSGDSIKFDVGKSFAEKMAEISTSLTARKELNAALSNERHCIPLTNQGTYDYTGAVTNVYVYYGFDDITSNSDVTVTPSNGLSGTWDRVDKTYTVTNLTVDSATATFNISYNGKSIQKVMTVTRMTDTTTEGAYSLDFNASIIKRSTNNTLTPSSLNVSAKSNQSGSSSAYSGRFVVEESIDGSYWESKYESAQDESQINYTPSTSNVNFIKVSLYKAFSDVDDAQNFTESYIAQNYTVISGLSGSKVEGENNGWSFTYEDGDGEGSGQVVYDYLEKTVYINNYPIYVVQFSRSDTNFCDSQTVCVISDTSDMTIGSRNLIRNSDTLIYETKSLNPNWDGEDPNTQYNYTRIYDFV